MRIVIVENERLVAMDIRRRVERLGMEVPLVATSGEEAVVRVGAVKPDLVLMDIVLDGEMDGIEAAQVIRAEYDLPVVYLTAHADPETLSRAKLTDASGYIIKPCSDRELAVQVEMALYKHTMESRLQSHERWLSTTLQSIADAVLTCDREGRLTYLNPAAERLLDLCGLDTLAETGRGPRLSSVLRLSEHDGGATVADLESRVLQPDSGLEEATYLAATGNGPVPVWLTVSQLRNDFGRPQGAVLVLRDESERQRSERALRDSLAQLKRAFQETVNALTITSEKRDPYTAGHQLRVAELASMMAMQLGLGEERVDGIRVAGLLHDLGKIYVPAEILSKPSRLTEMEMSLVRTHSQVGHEILSQVAFPWPVAEMVLQHHERMDGSGYPDGLAGEQIMTEARIIAVADVVEAMSSHRPYRPALGVEPALAEIRAGRGTRYWAEAVDACLASFDGGFTFSSVNR